MSYILKYYLQSKYYKVKRVQYKELENKEAVIKFINDKGLSRKDYEIFIKVI